MKRSTSQYINPQGDNPPILRESPTIIAERVKSLHSLFILVMESVFSNIQECIDPIVAWKILEQLYQQNSNASKFMLKNRLQSMHLHDGASDKEFVQQIQEIQVEVRGLKEAILDIESIEHIVNTLLPSYDSV